MATPGTTALQEDARYVEAIIRDVTTRGESLPRERTELRERLKRMRERLQHIGELAQVDGWWEPYGNFAIDYMQKHPGIPMGAGNVEGSWYLIDAIARNAGVEVTKLTQALELDPRFSTLGVSDTTHVAWRGEQ